MGVVAGEATKVTGKPLFYFSRPFILWAWRQSFKSQRCFSDAQIWQRLFIHYK